MVTLVPLTSLDPAAAAAWDQRNPFLAIIVNALGLHRAYSSPIFLVAVVLLTASTAACSWERMRAAVREWRGQCTVSASAIERVRTSPTSVIEVGEGIDEAEALRRASTALSRLHVRVRRESGLLVGSGGAVGFLGSPLFHWALVGLFVFAGAGQATRYEGYVNMIAGDTFADAPKTYSLDLSRAPLAGDWAFTGAQLTLVRIDFDHSLGGAARGRAPLMRLTREGTAQSERWVFPNSPLRYGPILVQRATSGPALVGTVETAGALGRQPIRLYYDEQSRSPRQFRVGDPAAATTLTVEVVPVGGQKVGVVVVAPSRMATQTIGVGETAILADGATFTVEDLTYYMQLQVVNDRSVPWVYAMFILGIVGMVLTTFVPPRTIHVMMVGDPDGPRLHVVTMHRKNDPAFPRRAERILQEGVAGRPVPDAPGTDEGDGTS